MDAAAVAALAENESVIVNRISEKELQMSVGIQVLFVKAKIRVKWECFVFFPWLKTRMREGGVIFIDLHGQILFCRRSADHSYRVLIVVPTLVCVLTGVDAMARYGR